MASYLDEPVVISEERPLRVSASAMRALAKVTGRSMTDLLQGSDDADAEADRMQAVAFLELHKRAARLGHMPDAGTLWDEAGNVEIDIAARPDDRVADPLDTASSKTSPLSADIGE
jgi:hypothetical protein